jgi:hypothetical protein
MVNNGGTDIKKESDELIKKYESIISIWTRWDESYWASFNYFLVINGLFFIAFYTIFSKTFGSDNSNSNNDIFLPLIICIGGLASCIIWLFILNKKLTFIYLAEFIGRKHEEWIYLDSETQGENEKKIKGCFYGNNKFMNENEKETYKDIHQSIKWYQKGFTKKGSGMLTAFALPLLFSIIWASLLIYVIYSFNPSNVNLSIFISIIFISVGIGYFLIAKREFKK